jgi:biotin carboxylase
MQADNYVLFVSISKYLDYYVNLAHRLGHKVILLSRKIDIDALIMVDVSVEIELNDKELVMQKVKELRNKFNICAVFTTNEYRVPLTKEIAVLLGLAHPADLDAVLKCRNKKLTREKLADKRISPVRYQVVTCSCSAKKFASEIGYPVVVKPSNDSGSRNVFCCRNEAELIEAFNIIANTKVNHVNEKLDSDIIVEEFLEGPEFSVEAGTDDEKTVIYSITAKMTTPLPYAVEIGHLSPARLEPLIKQQIEDLVRQAIDAIGLRRCVTHTEVKFTPNGPRIVEVNARPGGDEIPRLVHLTTGYDIRQIALYLALGYSLEEMPRDSIVARSAAIRFFASEMDGEVMKFYPDNIKDNSHVLELEFYVSPGDYVTKTVDNFSRLGHIICYDPDGEMADQLVNALAEQIQIIINPKAKGGCIC